MGKTGPFSKTEKLFIADNYQTKDDIWIAGQLNRTIETVQKYKKKLLATISFITPEAQKETDEYALMLEGRPYWRELNAQFTKDELELIIWHWSRFLHQFRGDITSSEEMQVLDLLRMEIFISRNITEKANGLKEVERLKKHISKLYDSLAGDDTTDRETNSIIASMENNLAAMRSSQRSSTDEHMKLDAQKQKLFRELKTTRDQRKKTIEDSQTSFKALLAALDEEKMNRRVAIEIDLRNRSREKEYSKLTEYHTYGDGEVDLPLLNAESIMLENQNEKEEGDGD